MAPFGLNATEVGRPPTVTAPVTVAVATLMTDTVLILTA
jgi:hypothetical protein